MIRVGIIRGGTSGAYGDSIASGAYVLKNLPREKYRPVDVFVDASGAWHVGGRPVSPDMLASHIDVAWNALDISHAADERIRRALEALTVPHLGPDGSAAGVLADKRLFKERVTELGIRTPRGMYVETWQEGDREDVVASVAAQAMRDFSPPWLVEPISRGHALAPVRAKTGGELIAALLAMLDAGIPVLIEEEVFGRHASVSVAPGFRGQSEYAFVPNGARRGRDTSASEALQAAARAVHKGLALGPYSRIEAIVTSRGKIVITAVDAVPSFAPESDLHASLAAVGATFGELADHLISSAL